MSISVPEKLKEEIDSVELRVNWSSVACSAFQQELLRINLMSGKEIDIEQSIERLRASDNERSTYEYANGFHEGKLWAASQATPTELRRLDDSIDENNPYWDCGFIYQDGQGYSVAEIWFATIQGMNNQDDLRDMDSREPDDFWDQVCGNTTPDQDFVKGFVLGAIEFWNQVKDRV